MHNSYHDLAVQIKKIELGKKASLFNLDISSEKFETEVFQRAFGLLKTRYCAIYSLFGESNFKEITYLFMQTNPIHSTPEEKYGFNFSDFLTSLPQSQSFYFVRFIAMLDWFWFSATSPKQKIQLPKGTLKSWGNILRGEDLLNIELDELEIEVLSIQKNGKEYKILEHPVR